MVAIKNSNIEFYLASIGALGHYLHFTEGLLTPLTGLISDIIVIL